MYDNTLLIMAKYFEPILQIRRALVCVSAGALMMMMGSCKTTQTATPVKYERPPIVETTQQQLETESVMIEAKMEQMTGDVEDAIAKYRSILDRVPDYAPAHYEMAQIMGAQNRLDSAVYHCQRAVGAADTNKWYHLLMAELYAKKLDAKSCIAEWESIVRLYPDVLEYYYELSNAYLMIPNIPKSIETLNRVEKKIGVTEPISLQKQKLWEAMKRPDKALKEVEALADAMPADTKYNAMIAQLWMTQGNLDEAKKYFDKVLAVDPDDSYTNLSLAQYYKEKRDEDNSYQCLKKGLENSDLTTQSKLMIIGNFYDTKNLSPRTAQLFESVLQTADDTVAYALFYGNILMRQEKYAEAARQFKIHLARDSSQYSTWEALLICESDLEGKEEELLDHARRASALFPLHVLPYYLQGYYAVQKDDYIEALNYFQQCEKVGFTNGYLEAECYALMSVSFHEVGDDDAAFVYMDKYLVMHPDDPEMLNNYAYYLAEAGRDLEKAEAMAKKAVAKNPRSAVYLDTYAWVLYKMGRREEAKPVMLKALRAEGGNHQEVYQQHWKEINNE